MHSYDAVRGYRYFDIDIFRQIFLFLPDFPLFSTLFIMHICRNLKFQFEFALWLVIVFQEFNFGENSIEGGSEFCSEPRL